jgi:2-haloacid dehalogenase
MRRAARRRTRGTDVGRRHPSDLRAARDAGLMTAYVARPLERGRGRRPPRVEDGEFDYVATDFLDLARQLEGVE